MMKPQNTVVRTPVKWVLLHCRCKPFVLNVAKTLSGWWRHPGMRHNGQKIAEMEGEQIIEKMFDGGGTHQLLSHFAVNLC